ncbi:hypothetical protein [Mycolicibacterium sp. lyk4-40-TYG-92]|uniref:hypothetical protein n=1 Tax=Mycolicibacterium sp. lyk4-40-TYG-92 TaxID=3040295 RepID=UPI0025501A32|nr:hypothetical protein [Mycolicibacterium sp. lyk4-40-TYG-92]
MLSIRHLDLALWCCQYVLNARRSGATPGVAPWNSEVIRAIELERAVALQRQQEADFPPHSKELDTRTVAEKLGWSLRTVQRRAADLDGRKTRTGVWLFPADTVHEYAEELSTNETHPRD